MTREQELLKQVTEGYLAEDAKQYLASVLDAMEKQNYLSFISLDLMPSQRVDYQKIDNTSLVMINLRQQVLREFRSRIETIIRHGKKFPYVAIARRRCRIRKNSRGCHSELCSN